MDGLCTVRRIFVRRRLWARERIRPDTLSDQGFRGVINTILTKVIGTKNERELKAIRPIIQKINGLEPYAAGVSPRAVKRWFRV